MPSAGRVTECTICHTTYEILRKYVPIEVNVAEAVESSHVVFLGSKLVELDRLGVVCISSFPF